MKKTLTNILRNSLLSRSFTLGCIASDVGYNLAAKNYTNTTSPERVQKEIDALIDWYNKIKDTIHPLRLAALFHMENLKKYILLKMEMEELEDS